MLESIEKLRMLWKKLPAPTRPDELLLADVDRCISEIEREIEERYMLLPVDADGVPIHVGDEMQDANGVKVIVEYVGSDGFCANETRRNGWCNYRHVKPRTVEDVLREFAKSGTPTGDGGVLYETALIEKYADKLRDMLGGDA